MVNILSIDFPLIGEAILIALVVLAFLMWYLTREILKMENILLYLDIIFTIIWAIASTTSTTEELGIPLSGFYGMIFYYLWLGFAGLSALFALIPYLMFLNKYLRFNEIKKEFKNVKGMYDEYNKVYNGTDEKISQIEQDLKKINSEIAKAIDMLEDAKRAPEKIILGETSTFQGEAVPAQLNIIIIGLGGVGTGLVSGIGIPSEKESYLKTSILNNLITKNVIKDGDEPFLFILYDTNETNIKSINEKYNSKLFLNIIKTFTYPNSWTQPAVTNANPYLVGVSFNLIGGAGAGNNRVVGAAAYNTIKDEFLNDIKNAISQLINRTHKDKTVIFIINSWGGGTGSGTFIKFAQDLREKLNEIPALRANPPYIWGIGVLPAAQEGDIFKANAYATFKEMTFMMQSEENIIGEVDKKKIRKTFDGYILVSRDVTNATRDIEIATGISNFIIDLSTMIKEQGQPLRFDITDIETRFNIYSPNNFSTIEFYTVYFPASILSWYKIIGQPRLERLNKGINDIAKEIDKIKNNIDELEKKIDKLSSNANSLADHLVDYRSKGPYKSFIKKIDGFEKVNDLIRADIGPNGKIDIRNLKNKINDLQSEDTSKKDNLPNTKQNVGYFESIVKSEEMHLKYPFTTGISYSFSVDPDKFALPNEKHGPEKIDIGALINPQYNLIEILKELGKEDELINAYNSLQKSLGQSGPMLALNYANIGVPMNLDLEIIDFIREVNPGLLSDLETNPSVRRPLVKNIVVLPSTNPEILSSKNFPTQVALTRNLTHSAKSVEYGQSSLPFKKYSITNYKILFNIPLYYYSPDEDAMMPMIKDYRNAYLKGVADNPLNMFLHHSLLYDIGIEGLRKLGVEVVSNETVRDQITRFWINYEPFIGDEDSSKLYTVLSFAKLYKGLNQIKKIVNNEVLGKIINLEHEVTTVHDLTNIQKKINELSVNTQNLIYDIDKLKESFENIDKIYKFANAGFKEMIDNMKEKVSELYGEINKDAQQFEIDINNLNKKLDELYAKFNTDKKITERNIIKRIKDDMNGLSKRLNAIIEGYAGIIEKPS